MEINARVRELYASHGHTNKMLFLKVLRDEFGLDLGKAKEILIKLDYGEEWTTERYHEEMIGPILEGLEIDDGMEVRKTNVQQEKNQ